MKYSKNSFIKIRHLCEYIQERIELGESKTITFESANVRPLHDFETNNILRILEKDAGVIKINKIELEQTPIGSWDIYTIEVLVKPFDDYIREELAILPVTLEQIGKINEINYLHPDISVNNGKKYLKLSNSTKADTSKAALIVNQLWEFRKIFKNGRQMNPGKFYSEENLLKATGCKSEEALSKAIYRVNKFMQDNFLPVKITKTDNNYQLLIEL